MRDRHFSVFFGRPSPVTIVVTSPAEREEEAFLIVPLGFLFMRLLCLLKCLIA
jgi:hypothetical protein